MPIQEQFTESYRKWCWTWHGPWRCKKWRTVTKWCYQFCEVKIHRWGFYCKHWGCENGKEYYWKGWCMGFGSGYVWNIKKCFKNKIKDNHKKCSCP